MHQHPASGANGHRLRVRPAGPCGVLSWASKAAPGRSRPESDETMAQRVIPPVSEAHSSLTVQKSNLPPEVETGLRAPEVLNDDVLWAIARCRMNLPKQRRWRRLLEKSRHGRLAESEQQELARLMTDNDRLTLCKAQAYLLLKQRGNIIPELDNRQPEG